MNDLEVKVRKVIRDVPDFPIDGILFKDITTLLANPKLSKEVLSAFVVQAKNLDIDAVVGIDSRGFLFGYILAMELGVPFVPVRKPGKLPCATFSESYGLEYGRDVLEMHRDGVQSNSRVLIHDDLLATGGTAAAASELVRKAGAKVVGFSFIVHLTDLPGRNKISEFSENLFSIVSY